MSVYYRTIYTDANGRQWVQGGWQSKKKKGLIMMTDYSSLKEISTKRIIVSITPQEFAKLTPTHTEINNGRTIRVIKFEEYNKS